MENFEMVQRSSTDRHVHVHSFLNKNIAFPSQAEYSYFSVDFRCERIHGIFLDEKVDMPTQRQIILSKG